jgi:hypothetical protein
VPTTEREDAHQALALLFKKLAITRIVYIDDVYALPSGYEDAVGLIVELGAEATAPIIDNEAIPLREEIDVWIEPFRTWWATLEESQRRLRLQRLSDLQPGADAGKNEQDLRAANALTELFAGQDFIQLSFSQWKDQGKEQLREAQLNRTLFLFDEDLRNDGGTETGGRGLIRDVLASPQAQTAMCGLLSHNIPKDQEFEIWKQFESAEYGFDGDRVVPVSKHTLEAEPLMFARAIKLTVLNPYCHALTKLSAKLIRKSQRRAQSRLEEINIYEFDRLVFGISSREGIWEPDTLFRLHNLFQRIEAREQANRSRKLRALAEQIRSVSDVPTDANSDEKRTDAWKIQRLELYENPEFINRSFLPIELGDIFEKTEGNKAKKPRYILLAQPCDLMVRSKTGTRKKTMSRVVLARIGTSRPTITEDAYYELRYFDAENGESGYVNFTDTYLVSLDALDLCAFNTEGTAKIKAMDQSKNLVLAWRKHHGVLLEVYKQLIKNRNQIEQSISSFNLGKKPEEQMSGVFVESLNPEFSTPPLFTLEIDHGAKSVTFDCRRVGRFEPNHSAAMWTKFCNFTSRAAFDVDLGN